jgi:glycosyltransferase involved in cell wall biosynthesis
MTNQRTDFSLLIPIYNERKIIIKNLRKILRALRKMKKSYEIIIVDDGSTDGSSELISKNFSHIKIIRYQRPSVRENLNRSFKYAKGEIVAFMDADLPVPLKYFSRLISEIENGYDIATGSRWMKESKIRRSFYRHVISFFYNNYVKFLFGSKVKDHQCGFKAFKQKVIFELADCLGYKRMRSWAWDAELLVRAQKKGYKISEFPIEWKGRKKSKVKTKDLKTFFYLFLIWCEQNLI